MSAPAISFVETWKPLSLPVCWQIKGIDVYCDICYSENSIIHGISCNFANAFTIYLHFQFRWWFFDVADQRFFYYEEKPFCEFQIDNLNEILCRKCLRIP